MKSDQRKLSALIPVLDEAENLGAFLSNLRALGVDEIIVADGGSRDGSDVIAAHYADVILHSPKGRGHQIAAAASCATGDIYWIVHCDSTPPVSARADIYATLSKPNVALGTFPVGFGDPHWALPFFEFCSTFDSAFSTFGDQGFFFSAEDYNAIGGAPQVALFEDVILRKKLKARGSVLKTTSKMGTSPRRFHRHGLFRQQLLNAYLIVLFHLGAPPDKLAALYNDFRLYWPLRKPKRLRHPRWPAWRPYKPRQGAGNARGSSRLLDRA